MPGGATVKLPVLLNIRPRSSPRSVCIIRTCDRFPHRTMRYMSCPMCAIPFPVLADAGTGTSYISIVTSLES